MPQFNDSIQAGMQAGTLPTDRMYRFPQPYGQGMGEAVGAAVQGMRPQQPYNPFPGNNPANLVGTNYGNFFGSQASNLGSQMGMEADIAAVEEPVYQNQAMPQMPQPSANNGGKYRLSPGVYGTKEQAMEQYSQRPSIDEIMRQRLQQASPYQNPGMSMPEQRRR
jgi:hypothetical protein